MTYREIQPYEAVNVFDRMMAKKYRERAAMPNVPQKWKDIWLARANEYERAAKVETSERRVEKLDDVTGTH